MTDKHRTSTGQVQDKFGTDNNNIISLVKVIGDGSLFVKDMMVGLNLKGRDNFINLYLTPSMHEGFVRMLYPKTPATRARNICLPPRDKHFIKQ